MRKKRRVKNSQQFQVAAHLKKLAFDNTDEYLRWCECNGFARTLNKSAKDRQNEHLHALAVGPGWRRLPESMHHLKIRVAGEAQNVEEKIFSGQLTMQHVVEKQYRPLAKAVAKLAGASFDRHQHTLRRLLTLCRERGAGLFIYAGRPFPGCRDSTIAEALALVAMDAQNWIRAPEDWWPPKGSHFDCFRDLVSHLYAKHAIPEFLVRFWFQDDVSHFDFSLRVFRHIAAGHSIRTIATGLTYSKRMSHFFLNAPARLSVRQAIRWGQVRGMGGSEQLADAVANSVLGADFSNEAFWNSVIDWLIKNPLNPSLVGPAIRYLNNQKFGVGNLVRCVRDHRGRIRRETMAVAQPNLTMKGRTPRSLTRDINRFQCFEQVYGRLSEYVWVESGIPSFMHQDADGDVWTITELLGSGALVQEGQRMSHCVGEYANDCLDGESTIWSMCRLAAGGTKHALTIEVDPDTREIIQARGFANRWPSNSELEILKKWCRSARLECWLIER